MKILVCVFCALMVFAMGYKVGESSGYKEGFDEGYSYDCRAELGNIAKFVYSLKDDLKASQDSLHVVRQNLRSAVVTKKQAELDSLFENHLTKDTTLEYVDEYGQRHMDSRTILGGRRSFRDSRSR